MIYLACPYSHDDPGIMEARFEYVTKVAGHLIKQGEIVYSPITNSHQINKVANIGGTWADWEKFDLTLLSKCDRLMVVCIPGWGKSIGVAAEINYAKNNLKSVTYLDPATLPPPLDWEGYTLGLGHTKIEKPKDPRIVTYHHDPELRLHTFTCGRVGIKLPSDILNGYRSIYDSYYHVCHTLDPLAFDGLVNTLKELKYGNYVHVI